MFTFQFYVYSFLIFIWLIYFANSLYQNWKMKRFFPNKIKDIIREIFITPFYVFIAISSFILAEKLFLIIFKERTFAENSSLRLFQIMLILAGIFLCFASVSLYTYVNFFEKSFPSCLTLKNKKPLGGIYNYIRHPSYYIFSSLLFGTALILQDVLLLTLSFINHVSLYFYYIIEENRTKKENHYYAEYLKKTKRFFPRFLKV